MGTRLLQHRKRDSLCHTKIDGNYLDNQATLAAADLASSHRSATSAPMGNVITINSIVAETMAE